MSMSGATHASWSGPSAGPRSTLLPRLLLVLLALLALPTVGCNPPEGRRLAPRTQTFAELRVVRRGVTVTEPSESARPPVPRERLVDGAVVEVAAGGLAWLRRDAGATLLVAGPARVVALRDAIEVGSGKVFVDAPGAEPTRLRTKAGPIELSRVRASVEVDASGEARIYVLEGEVRVATKKGDAIAPATAVAGEELRYAAGDAPDAPKADVRRVVAWEDWTGGLATTDRTAAPAPFGVGTVGARPAGNLGAPRQPLVIQSMDVSVVVDGDFAVTEVEQEFFNPASETVEGIYRMRLPRGASLERFGVDRLGAIAWGYVKEKAQAAAQYQANVYQGSTEDPALLQWMEPGVFEAKLYPLGPGATRRVVMRWTEWLPRGGAKGERRLYIFPMAAEGAEASLPLVEELTVSVDVMRAGAREIRAGMDGLRIGESVVVRRQDFVPRADLAIELFDDGVTGARASRAPHRLDESALSPADRGRVPALAGSEPEYIVVPIRPEAVKEPAGGLDLAIVVDTSAATDEVELALARAATRSLLAHLGEGDRVAVLAADDRLRPAAPGSDVFTAVDVVRRRAIEGAISDLRPGGATDLGAVLVEASARLDPARRGAVVYIGDGAPTVGERSLGDLRARLAKSPRPARVFALATGDGADLALLDGVAQGGFAQRVTDGGSAARAALAVLEAAERPALLRATVDLGPGVERIYPRDLSALAPDQAILLVGRLVGTPPEVAVVRSPAGETRIPLEVKPIVDRGDMRRRWAEARLVDMMEEGAGRAALVDLGVRQGILTPVTSFYVPTTNEMTPAEVADLRRRAQSGELAARDQDRRDARDVTARGAAIEDGELRKNEEGDDQAKTGGKAEPEKKRREEKEDDGVGFFDKMLGARKSDAAAPEEATAAAPAAAPVPQAAATAAAAPEPVVAAPPPPPAGGDMPQEDPAAPRRSLDQAPPNGLRQELGSLSGIGEGGGGKGEGQGFGSGHGRLGGSHRAAPEGSPRGPSTPPMDELRADGGERNRPAAPPALEAPKMPAPSASTGATTTTAPDVADAWKQTVTESAAKTREGKDAAGWNAGLIDGRVSLNKKSGEVANFLVVQIAVGDRLGRKRLGCSPAADAPLLDRLGLWRERLARTGGNPNAVATVYRTALALCEAPGPRERSLLLGAMLDALPTPSLRVLLWQTMQRDLGAKDLLYRGLLVRVRTADEARELARALGLRTAPPESIAKALKEAKDAADRVVRLRNLAAAWPDDHDLSLLLLDALEDADDAEGARALGRSLRRRADVDARVRTAVGELHLRLAAAGKDAARRADDEQEARRAFGEIVEFAPDDPAARRRLGDLLRSHGWFEEAARQYETLAALLPDDPGVALLRAAAAEGVGKLEEAVQWADKAVASGPPDATSGPAATARALAATFLGWGQLAARERKDADEERRLSARKTKYLRAASPGEGPRARVALIWSHPDVHPTLWSDALGPPLPATEGDPSLGVAQVDAAARPGGWVEVRIDPAELERVARLGAELDLLFASNEGQENERILRKKVKLTRGGPDRLRFAIDTGDELPVPAEKAEAGR